MLPDIFDDTPRSFYRFVVDDHDASPYDLPDMSGSARLECSPDERSFVREQVWCQYLLAVEISLIVEMIWFLSY